MLKMCLYNLNPGINLGIIPYKTGVTWYNQTGCLLCDHSEIEGFSIPLAYMYLDCTVGEFDIRELMERTELMYNLQYKNNISKFRYEVKSLKEAWVKLEIFNFPNDIFKIPEEIVIDKMFITWRNCD